MIGLCGSSSVALVPYLTSRCLINLSVFSQSPFSQLGFIAHVAYVSVEDSNAVDVIHRNKNYSLILNILSVDKKDISVT